MDHIIELEDDSGFYTEELSLDSIFREVNLPSPEPPEMGSEIDIQSCSMPWMEPVKTPISTSPPKKEEFEDFINFMLDDDDKKDGLFKDITNIKSPGLNFNPSSDEEEKPFKICSPPPKKSSKFQIRIKPNARKNQLIDHKEEVQPKRSRGRPRIQRSEDRPKHRYVKRKGIENNSDYLNKLTKTRTREQVKRDELKKPMDILKLLVPGLCEKTDKVSVLCNASRYVSFLKSQVGEMHDSDFLLQQTITKS